MFLSLCVMAEGDKPLPYSLRYTSFRQVANAQEEVLPECMGLLVDLQLSRL